MKTSWIERQRVKMFKPNLLSEKKCLEKDRVQLKIIQRFWCNNEVVYLEVYSLSEESLLSNSEEEIAYSNINNYSQLKIYKKGHVLGNRNCLFASLDKLAFYDSFGSFQLRQLIVDHKKITKIYMLTILKVILMVTYNK